MEVHISFHFFCYSIPQLSKNLVFSSHGCVIYSSTELFLFSLSSSSSPFLCSILSFPISFAAVSASLSMCSPFFLIFFFLCYRDIQFLFFSFITIEFYSCHYFIVFTFSSSFLLLIASYSLLRGDNTVTLDTRFQYIPVFMIYKIVS